ncbi:MAG TPA: bacillithiol system redox-active protein YtxJ [Saprospiraceae bacterium]|nr:bacillithiol system redox-active protein YtxJ [Saprospiraceae bacterium]
MAIQWHKLESADQIEQIIQRSKEIPCIIYKHSNRCHICSIAQYRLEDDWSFGTDEVEAYYLDVIAHRPVSMEVANTFQVHHESPQVLLIMDGECVYDASHLDIQFQEILEEVKASKI